MYARTDAGEGERRWNPKKRFQKSTWYLVPGTSPLVQLPSSASAGHGEVEPPHDGEWLVLGVCRSLSLCNLLSSLSFCYSNEI